MKLRSLTALIPLFMAFIAAPLMAEAKEHNKEHRNHGVVNASRHQSHNSNHHNMRSHRKHYRSHHSYRSHQYRSHQYRSHQYRSHQYRNNRHHNHSSNIAAAIILGSALHHSYGIYGSHYNGHAWCPTHTIYHTHNISYSGHYDNSRRNKVDSTIEEEDGRCFRVTEYDNGDERRKRIRNYHCDELTD